MEKRHWVPECFAMAMVQGAFDSRAAAASATCRAVPFTVYPCAAGGIVGVLAQVYGEAVDAAPQIVSVLVSQVVTRVVGKPNVIQNEALNFTAPLLDLP